MKGIDPKLRLAVVAVGVVVLIAAAFLLPGRSIAERLGSGLEGTGPWRPFLFGGAYVVLCLLLVPGSAVTLVVGAALGFPLGFAVVYSAAVVAALLAFLIARHLARRPIERLARRLPAFRRIDAAMGAGGWKVVALLRLSPLVPFSITNYLLGLTSVRFRDYLVGTLLAIPPGTMLYVWLASAGRSGIEALRRGESGSPWKWALVAVGIAASAAFVFYVGRLAHRRLEARGAR
jgi:uncharacterized membrane protein YdjX (TVP38/TMEM64 family)